MNLLVCFVLFFTVVFKSRVREWPLSYPELKERRAKAVDVRLLPVRISEYDFWGLTKTKQRKNKSMWKKEMKGKERHDSKNDAWVLAYAWKVFAWLYHVHWCAYDLCHLPLFLAAEDLWSPKVC